MLTEIQRNSFTAMNKPLSNGGGKVTEATVSTNYAPGAPRIGEYVMNFPTERSGDRDTARQVMRRNGCRSIRFEKFDSGLLVVHGYIGRLSGPGVEDL
jgi:hypothetical protein